MLANWRCLLCAEVRDGCRWQDDVLALAIVVDPSWMLPSAEQESEDSGGGRVLTRAPDEYTPALRA